MSRTERRTKTRFLRTGIAATLPAALLREGTAVPSSSSSARVATQRPATVFAAALLALVVVMGLVAAPAFAKHEFTETLPTPTGGFHEPLGVAVGTSGEVFVSNAATNVVDVYEGGRFETEFTVGEPGDPLPALAVDRSTDPSDPSRGDLYVADQYGSTVYRYKYELGTPILEGSISTLGSGGPDSLAVESNGDVYVGRAVRTINEEEGLAVSKYDPTGALITENLITEEETVGPHSLAVDSSGTLFTAGREGIHMFNGETGACIISCETKFGDVESRAGGIAFGPEGNLYVGQNSNSNPPEISVDEPNGNLIERFDPSHPVLTGNGVALSGTTVYVTDAASNEVAVFAPPKFPLDLFLAGHGTVTSSPPGLTCSTEECAEEFSEGPLTLTATPAPGYTFVGWLGCKHASATTCTVNITAATEVTAVFLEKGATGAPGQPGETPVITPFSGNQNGCPIGGLEITVNSTQTFVCNGTNGSNGSNGSNGTNGKDGADGANGKDGAQGPQGATGPTGPAAKVTCTVKQSASSSAARLRWRLMRGSQVFRHGATSSARHLRLHLYHLPRGRYLLHIRGQSGGTSIVVG